MFNLLNDEDVNRLGLAIFHLKNKDEGEQDARGWNKCLASVWKIYSELKESDEKEC